MSYKHITVLLVAVVAICITSCKKKSNSNPFGGSKIATVTVSNNGSAMLYHIVYDSYDNVDTITITGDSASSSAGFYQLWSFNYFGTSYSITDQGNSFTINMDANGNILKILVADTTTLLYSNGVVGEVNVWMPQATYPFYAITQTSYIWQGGNVTSVVTGANTYTYDYDKSKPGQPGDAWRMIQFLQYGRSYIKTSNLPVDMMNGSTWVEKYSYVTDGSGRITQFTKVLNNGAAQYDTTVYSYTYY